LPARPAVVAPATPFSFEDDDLGKAVRRPRPPARGRPRRSAWPWILVGVGAAIGLAIASIVLVVLLRRGTEDLASWQEFTSAEGRFRVQMPGQPVKKTQQAPNPLGGQLTFHMFAYEVPRDEYGFVVGYNDYPPLPPDRVQAVLDGVTKGNVQGNAGSKLISETRITLGSYPGREVTIDAGGKGTIRQRNYLVGNRLYQVMLVKGGRRPSAEAAEKFFSSFRVTDEPAVAAGKDKRKPPEGPGPKEKLPKREEDPGPKEKLPVEPPPPAKSPGEILTFPMPHGNIHSIAFAPDGQTLATTGDDHTIRLWDPATGQERAKLTAGGPMIEFLAFSPDGKWLATRGGNNVVSLREGGSGKLVAPLDVKDIVSSVAFSPDSRTLAVAAGGTVKFWDVITRQEGPPLRDGRFIFHDAKFTADGKGLLTAQLQDGQVRTVKVWDLDTRKDRADLKGFGVSIGKLALAPDGKHVATLGMGNLVRLADVSAGKELPSIEVPANGLAWMIFAADSRGVLTWGPDGFVRLWDVATREQRGSFRGAPPGRPVTGVAVTRDGGRLATVGANTITIWDAATVLAGKGRR
jgi:hypothetical protein